MVSLPMAPSRFSGVSRWSITLLNSSISSDDDFPLLAIPESLSPLQLMISSECSLWGSSTLFVVVGECEDFTSVSFSTSFKSFTTMVSPIFLSFGCFSILVLLSSSSSSSCWIVSIESTPLALLELLLECFWVSVLKVT